ncbi:MAG: glutathione S-transferase N-terminal domain-containing protein [Parasporobacterium sp.]|nr:glutathione S-transferase N-terminal domain-containing protein [Parasporobacterium sp.]
MKLELFMFDTCPYCRRVIREIEESGRTDIEYLNIHKSAEARNRLISVGGLEQVPCLFIDGEPLYESADIIHWLKQHPSERG